MNEDNKKELDDYNRITLPQEIDHDTYNEFLQLITYAKREYPNTQIDVYCNGDGGFINEARAIADLIRWHGNVRGVLIGEAVSCHAVVWASCPVRAVYPNAVLAIHFVNNQLDSTYTADELIKLSKDLAMHNNWVLDVFEGASNKSRKWWSGKCMKAGLMTEKVKAETLVQIEMAEYYA